jgi:hypothetical protein
MEGHMSTTAHTRKASQPALDSRVLNEGYGPGAWHGPDLKAALADVTPALAFWRPAKGRHNIAEIALHHAYFVRSVRAQISGATAEPFVLPGEDWFEVTDQGVMTWPKIKAVVESEQRQLAETVAAIEAGAASSALADAGRFNLVLGIAGHAIYHAGQVQLVKRLKAA